MLFCHRLRERERFECIKTDAEQFLNYPKSFFFKPVLSGNIYLIFFNDKNVSTEEFCL